MIYSIVGIASIVICLIVNSDVLFGRGGEKNLRQLRSYRWFLISTIIFFVTDAIWGLLDEYHLVTALFVDTSIYFLAMGFSVISWTRYATFYLEKRKIATPAIMAAGTVISLFAIGVIIANFFTPILFYFDEAAAYHPLAFRYALLTAQLVLYFIVSLYAFVMAFHRKGQERKRYFAIFFFGIAMGVFIMLQTWFPYMPFYAIGCTVGIAIIRSYVIGSERSEYRKELEQRTEELTQAIEIANTDPLTGSKSRHAYVNLEEEVDRKIACQEITEFAVVVFDINGLKRINDTMGHEFGDEYIRGCYNLIKSVYLNTLIYRFGGDEFVALLTEEDYANRQEMLEAFEKKVDEGRGAVRLLVSSGMSDYIPEKDNTLRAVFMRADTVMYERKAALKARK